MVTSSNKRRRFQAPITSFFSAQLTQPNDGTVPQQEAVSSPPLPEAIQSSLLTVGMRIRKSVPEGYKTHKTINPSSALHTNSGYFLDSGVQPGSQPATFTTHRAYTELAPFCGLHKIGGMAVQPMPTTTSRPDGYVPHGRGAQQIEEPGPWSLCSSQESTDSNVPTAPTPCNKRSFTFDLDDDDEFGCAGPLGAQQPPPHPFNHPFISNFNTPVNQLQPQSHFLQPQTNNSDPNLHRPFAIPRTRLASSKRPKPSSLEGQENINPPMSVVGRGPPSLNPAAPDPDLDFEDAEFLEAREALDGNEDEFMDG